MRSQLARCPIDGVPLLLVTYEGVVMVGCELCDRAHEYLGPRLAPLPQRTDHAPVPRAVARPTCFAEAVRAFALRSEPC